MPVNFVLDTDTVTHFQRGHPVVIARIAGRTVGEVAIGVVTVEEQIGGWYAQLRRCKTDDQMEAAYLGLARAIPFLASFPILPFPRQVIDRFNLLRRQKLNVGRNDLRIAAIALEIGATVVTRNLRDFGRVPGLSVVDWTL